MTPNTEIQWVYLLFGTRVFLVVFILAGALIAAIVSPIIQAFRVRRLRREQGLSVQDDKDGPTGISLQ